VKKKRNSPSASLEGKEGEPFVQHPMQLKGGKEHRRGSNASICFLIKKGKERRLLPIPPEEKGRGGPSEKRIYLPSFLSAGKGKERERVGSP